MMRNRWILGTAVIMVACLSIIMEASRPHYRDVIDEAKIVCYEGADDVVNNSVLIVSVKKIDETQVAYPLENNLQDCFTISTVEVEEVFQDFSDAAIFPGSEIEILESQWIDEENKIVHHTAGYLKMEIGKQYFLLLGYNSSVNNYYPLGLLYGKIPYDQEEQLFLADGYEQVKSTIEDLRQIWGIGQ